MTDKSKPEPEAPAEGVNPADEVGAAEVAEKAAEESEKGYLGAVPDETPNENYTLGGVTSGAPTPETTRADR